MTKISKLTEYKVLVEPRTKFFFQELDFYNNSHRVIKSKYQIYLVLPNFTEFFYFALNNSWGIVKLVNIEITMFDIFHVKYQNKTSFHLHIQSKELYRGYHIWQGHESQSQVLVFIYFWKWGNGLPAWNNKFRDPHVNYSFGSWLESHLIFLNNKVQIMFLIDQKIKQNSGFPLNQLLYGRKVWIVSTESIQAGILNESSMYNCYFVIYATQNDLNKTLQN